MSKKALVMGFFSTVGDVECLTVVSRWLDHAGIPHEPAAYSAEVRKAIPGARDPRRVNPEDYSHLVVVCGPCWRELFKDVKVDLGRFDHCVRVGVNLTMIAPLEEWNPFDVLIERDSDRARRPDLTFLEQTPATPVVARCLAPRQKEYRERQRHDVANRVIAEFIERRDLAVIDVDTKWPRSRNRGGLGSPGQVHSVMQRVDVVLTTRLHGLTFALKSGVPAIAVDAVAGGDKVITQARTIGWPMAVLAEEVTPEWLDQALDWCLSPQAGETVAACQARIRESLDSVKGEFLEALQAEPGGAEARGGWLSRLFRSR